MQVYILRQLLSIPTLLFLALILIVSPACSSSSSEDSTGEAEPEPAGFNESIVGEWSSTNNKDPVSFEFFADGTYAVPGPEQTDVATYRFIDEDTIALKSGERPEELADISMPQEDILTLAPVDKDGNPRGEALELRSTLKEKELVQQQVGDFELQQEIVDPKVREQVFEAQTGERVLLYKASDGSDISHILLNMPTPEDAERKRQEWITLTSKEVNTIEFNTKEEPRTVNGQQVGTAVLFNAAGRNSGKVARSTGVVWNNGTLVALVVAEKEANVTSFYRSLSEYY